VKKSGGNRFRDLGDYTANRARKKKNACSANVIMAVQPSPSSGGRSNH